MPVVTAPPLISCLMVTRGELFPARFAIQCFQAQDYAPREPVIVTDALSAELRAHIAGLADPDIRLAIAHRRAWKGSMLARRGAMPAYPDVALGEDSQMLVAFAQSGTLGLLDRPELYCYIFHGRNAWPSRHFDGLYQSATARFEFSAYEPALAQLTGMPVAAYRAALDA